MSCLRCVGRTTSRLGRVLVWSWVYTWDTRSLIVLYPGQRPIQRPHQQLVRLEYRQQEADAQDLRQQLQPRHVGQGHLGCSSGPRVWAVRPSTAVSMRTAYRGGRSVAGASSAIVSIASRWEGTGPKVVGPVLLLDPTLGFLEWTKSYPFRC